MNRYQAPKERAKDSSHFDPSIASDMGVNGFGHLWTAKPGVSDVCVQFATACPRRCWTVVVPWEFLRFRLPRLSNGVVEDAIETRNLVS
jgi:hypothetical protein